MKLYLYEITNYFNTPKLTVEEFDVEEKPKTYVCRGRRFYKTDIGHVSGYCNSECILLENNPKKACEILLLQKETELKRAKDEVARKEAEIENLKRYVKMVVDTDTRRNRF